MISGWLENTWQGTATVGTLAGPFRRFNSYLDVAQIVMLLLFLCAVWHHSLIDEDGDSTVFAMRGWRVTVDWLRLLLLLLGCLAHTLATVVLGGSTAPSIDVCWRPITMIRSLNAFMLIAVAVALASWLAVLRRALDAKPKSASRIVGVVGAGVVLSLAWGLSYFFTWHYVAAEAAFWRKTKCAVE
jgi:hypothetical protein